MPLSLVLVEVNRNPLQILQLGETEVMMGNALTEEAGVQCFLLRHLQIGVLSEGS